MQDTPCGLRVLNEKKWISIKIKEIKKRKEKVCGSKRVQLSKKEGTVFVFC